MIEQKTKDYDAVRSALDIEFDEKFYRWVVTGKENFKKSQKAPKKNDGPVKIIVGKQFKKLVTNRKQDMLLEFYAPWCGHCQALEPKYNQLGELFKGLPVTIAKIDAQVSEYIITISFPTKSLILSGQ